MPRLLATRQLDVGIADVDRFVAAARVRRSVAQAHAVHYWVFTDAEHRNRFTEFVEAGAADRLDAVLVAFAAESDAIDNRIFTRSTEFPLD
jgi:hypothetical protein